MFPGFLEDLVKSNVEDKTLFTANYGTCCEAPNQFRFCSRVISYSPKIMQLQNYICKKSILLSLGKIFFYSKKVTMAVSMHLDASNAGPET